MGEPQPIVPFAEPDRRPDREQLGRAQKMEALGQITGGIAHELNNMLLAINLNLEALAEEVPASAATQPMFDGAHQAIAQASDLILQLLSFSRRRTLAAGDFDVNRAVIETRVLLRLVLPANIEIETALHPHSLSVFADRSQFEMALLNLALNAGDAMPRGGKLTIATTCFAVADPRLAAMPNLAPGNYVAIAVSDTGAGMPAEVAARAFEPFFTTRAAAGHSGLGLSQVYGYAQQSRGRVELDSGPAGTTVRLLLPIGHDTATARRDPAPAAGKGETILMVEDQPLVRQAVGRMLSDLGYRVLAASGPEEALVFLESHSRIDLLFTDMMLPGCLGGDELAVVAHRLRPDIRVLYTTGYSELTPPGAADNPNSVIAKPYTKDKLAHQLRAVLGG